MDAEDLPPGWAWATLDNFVQDRGASVDPSRSPDKKFTLYSVPAHATGKPEVLAGKDIGSTKQVLQPGTVLLSKINPRISRVWITADHGPDATLIGSTEWITFPSNSIVSSCYLKLFLMRENVRRYLTANVAGVGGSLMRVNAGTVGKIEIPLAPAAEQVRIAAAVNALFEELDEAEAALARAREGVGQFRASLLHAACTGALTAEWRAANPPTETGADLLRRILAERRATWERTELARLTAKGTAPRGGAWKSRYTEPAPPDQSDLPDLPAGWVWAALEQVCELVGGITVDSKRSGPDLVEVPYLRVANVQRGFLKLQQMKTIKAPPGIIEKLALRANDLLMNEGGDRDKLGRGWVWHSEIPNCIHQNHVYRARPYLASIDSRFLSHYFNEIGRAFFFDAATQTVNLASVNMSKVSRAPVPIPPELEIAEIMRRIGDTLSQTESTMTEVEQGPQLRQSILHAAFTGRLVPQDPADEPAAALLARLRATAAPARRTRRRSASEAFS